MGCRLLAGCCIEVLLLLLAVCSVQEPSKKRLFFKLSPCLSINTVHQNQFLYTTSSMQVFDRVVYPQYFSDQTPEISKALSRKTVAALKQLGVLDEQGNLTDDPRQGFKGLNWRVGG